jgi:hypothetical protein
MLYELFKGTATVTRLTQSMSVPQWNTDKSYTFDLSSYSNIIAVVGGVSYSKSQLSNAGGQVEFSVKSCTYNSSTKQATLVIHGGNNADIRVWSATCYVDVIQ